MSEHLFGSVSFQIVRTLAESRFLLVVGPRPSRPAGRRAVAKHPRTRGRRGPWESTAASAFGKTFRPTPEPGASRRMSANDVSARSPLTGNTTPGSRVAAARRLAAPDALAV